MQEYTLQIIHKAGKSHVDGDCLSRYPPEPNLVSQLNALEIGDPFLQGKSMVEEQHKNPFILNVTEQMIKD